ncbi:MAG: pyruvate, water dikinase regulatory protein [Coriobacteriia bacterium]
MQQDRAIGIHILSDSIGETAEAVARAALAQFPDNAFVIEHLPKVTSAEQLRELVREHCGVHCVFFYTFVQQGLRDTMRSLTTEFDLRAIDVVGRAVDVLAAVYGTPPRGEAGVIRRADEAYFGRIEAMEFAIRHDDGMNPQELRLADIVLIGPSRTSKTPLSVYLAYRGYLVANVPLAPGTEPPHELFEIDPKRIFGLLSRADVLADIRAQRMAELGMHVARYAEPESIEIELTEARALMRRLGCLTVRTDNRAIEETAQEIMRYMRGAVAAHD